MRLGFNWELGPFELWDAAGVEATVARMTKEGKPVAANVEKLLAAGQKSLYADDAKTASGRKYWELTTGDWQPVRVPDGVWSVTVAKKSNGVVKKNSGASLIDLGDGVARFELLAEGDDGHHHHLVCTRCAKVRAVPPSRVNSATPLPYG